MARVFAFVTLLCYYTAMHATTLCLIALAEFFPANASVAYTDKQGEQYLDRFAVCIEIAHKAEASKVSPSLAVAIAVSESGLKHDAVGQVGERGPMQVIPKYACPKGKAKGCDFVQAGINTIKYWQGRYKKLTEVLCHYNAGNVCNKRSRAYARRVIRRRHRYKTQMKFVSWDFDQDDKVQ